MPLNAQIDALGITQITGKIDGVLAVLADIHPKVTVNGQEVPLSIEAATGLAPVLDLVKQIPTDPKALEGAVKSMLAELQTLAALPNFDLAASVAANLAQIRGTIDTIARQFGGDPSGIVEELIGGGSGGLQQVLSDLAKRVTDLLPTKLPDEIRVPFAAIELLAGGALDAVKLADVFARFLLGVDLATLREPSLAINASIDVMAALDVDLNALAARFGDLAARIRAVFPRLQVAEPDVAAVLATLVEIRGGIDALFADLPPAIERLAQSLDRIDTDKLAARLIAAARAVIDLTPNVKLSIVDEIVDPLRGLGQHIASLTPETITAAFDNIAAQIREALAGSEIEILPKLLSDYQELALARLRAIGLSRFRDEIVGALMGVEARIRQFPFSAPQLLAGPVDALRKKLDQLDTKPITDALKVVEAKVKDVVGKIDLEGLKTQIGAQFDAVKGIVNDAVTEVKKVDAELQKIAAQVDSLDFQAAADQARELMEGIRKQVEDLLSDSELGAAVRSALSLAAEPLGQIDFHAEVSAPIDAQLDKIDPTTLVEPLKAITDKLRGVLDAVTPSSLVKKLDEPFNIALAEIEQYKPSALLAAATREIGKLEGMIDAIDPRVLVAPLQGEFDKIVAAVRAAANPDPLFAPIDDAWAAINRVLDKVDLVKILGGIVGKITGMPEGISSGIAAAAAQGQAAVAQAGNVLPFKFGDLIRPFALLVRQVRAEVEKLPEAVIGGALTAFAAPLMLIRGLLDGDKGLIAQFVAALHQRVNMLVPGNGAGPASDLFAALHELELTVEASAHFSAEAHVQIGGGAASLKLDTRMTLIVDVRAQLDDAVSRLFARLAPPDLERELRRAIDALERFLPPAIASLPLEATVKERLDAFFGAFDPTPLADELDALSAAIEAKLATLATEIIKGIFRFLDAIFGSIEGVLPAGLLQRLETFMKAVREELLGLDPAPIKEEMHHLIDSVIAILQGFSPQAIAGELGILFDDLKAKIKAVTGLFGPGAIDTTALDAPFEQLKKLQPSAVLAPLAASAGDLEKALAALLDIKIGESLVKAIVRLRAAIEAALDDLLAEFEALLDFLKEGGANVSASASGSI